MAGAEAPSPPAGPAQRYPPLLVLAAAVAVAILLLPSALHIPQTNPNPVLEYAPVPPEEPNPEAPPGNFSSLGLGGSSTLSQGARPATPSPPATRKPSALLKPRSTRCYLDPQTGERRQTEDPMSPVCVDFFEGDNFGATWQGVTADEITAVIYFDAGIYNNEPSPGAGEYIDLDAPAGPPCQKTQQVRVPPNCDHMLLRIARAYGTYFNSRFQTYGRRVHYWARFASGGSSNSRISDALDIINRLKPFAVLDEATFGGNNQDFEGALAVRDVLVFTSETALPASFFRDNAPDSYGFWPDIEHWAELYLTYLCTRVAPHPVSRFGQDPYTAPPNGQPRRYGLFYTNDPGEPGLRYFADLVKRNLGRCGISPVAEGTFPRNGYTTDANDQGLDQRRAVDRFKSNNVTTVLWLGGIEGQFTNAAAENGYFPEIVLAGDLDLDNNVAARQLNQAVMRNAWGISFQLRMDSIPEQPAFRAYREAAPGAPTDEARYANDQYRDHFMLFSAIQVAGPRLTPARVDEGFHALPRKQSRNPLVAACWFDPGDYTCVKDAMEIWWDPTGTSPGDGQAGCWRVVDEGRRYPAGAWPALDDKRPFRNPNDRCTGFDGSRRLRL